VEDASGIGVATIRRPLFLMIAANIAAIIRSLASPAANRRKNCAPAVPGIACELRGYRRNSSNLKVLQNLALWINRPRAFAWFQRQGAEVIQAISLALTGLGQIKLSRSLTRACKLTGPHNSPGSRMINTGP
jgi:hypothetical protein